MTGAAFKLFAGQRAFELDVVRRRVCALVARRQYGKTTIAARIALKKMMKQKNHTVLFGSVKIDLGREMIRIEAQQVQDAFALLANERLKAVDPTGKPLEGLTADDFADLYEALRLEFRYYHSQSSYSRTKVIALTPEAVGETGDLIVDEFERVKRGAEVWEAIEPFVSRSPDYRCIFTLTPPTDDRHISWTMFAPPLGQDLPVMPEGDTYESEYGFFVRRVTAFDAFADGLPFYDLKTGDEITPDEARRRARDKEAWDRNYGCKFTTGGSAAIDLMSLTVAQQRGIGKCLSEYCESDLDFQKALAWLRDHLVPGRLTGIGFDVATTTSGQSNPSSVTVTQRSGIELTSVLNVLWKTRDPKIARERLRRIIETCKAKDAPARRLAIDASNERYFAEETRQEFGALIPVELVVAGDVVEPRPPGYEAEKGNVNYKTWTGDSYSAEVNDNHYALPPESYFKKDQRSPIKNAGRYECEVDADGGHGDTFDSGKLAQLALSASGGGLTDADVRALPMLQDENEESPFEPDPVMSEVMW